MLILLKFCGFVALVACLVLFTWLLERTTRPEDWRKEDW